MSLKLNTIYRKSSTTWILLLLFMNFTQAQNTEVKVYFNINHTLEGHDSFERSKYITIHANQTENEWNGDNFTDDLRKDFLEGYDVYLGRDTGGISWYVNQMPEDPARTGYADPTSIEAMGLSARNRFENNTALHPYENRKNLVVAAQLHPFWTGDSQMATGQGWKFQDATATGEYMGRYIHEFHGQNGQAIPSWVEVINEPAYESLGGPNDYTNSLQEIAEFHNEVAVAIRAQVPDIKIGGYTTAFPNFEKGNFQRWENRWKLFMDVAGENMDFWSIHLYDFPSIHNGKMELRSGSNIEATFDMMEHYSMLSFDQVKPFVISEYGAQMHDYAKDQWSPYRDWLHIKASNSQLMSFLERPNTIASVINFIIVKAEWGYSNGIPYNHRLMRKENEPDSYTGQWVYTDMVKFYQLWQHVNGKRIRTTSSDPDLQVDAYVEGNKAYLILNNLNHFDSEIDLNSVDAYGTQLKQINKKHLTLKGNLPVLEDEDIDLQTTSVTLGAESTMILTYKFEDHIVIDETSDESKYYASSYLKDITASQDILFDINNVVLDEFGEAVLRIGIGRDHGKSLIPSVTFNDVVIEVPENWRGDDQKDRESFFGVLEIPVPFELLKGNNTVSVNFSDANGKVSSVSLQVFNFSDDFATLSIEDSGQINSKVHIYPNPSNSGFNYVLPFNYPEGSLSIYSINGKLVYKQEIFGDQRGLVTHNLAPGVYYARFFFKGNIQVTKKLIIQ